MRKEYAPDAAQAGEVIKGKRLRALKIQGAAQNSILQNNIPKMYLLTQSPNSARGEDTR